MTGPYLHLYTNCGNFMSTLPEKDQDSRRELFQFGGGGTVVSEQNQFIGV